MKTNKQNNKNNSNKISDQKQDQNQIQSGTGLSELKNRSEQGGGVAAPDQSKTNAEVETKTETPEKTLNSQPRTLNRAQRINFAEREYNRKLPVEKILAVLKRWMPRQYELAEVVGQWIWITFPEQPSEQVRADLSQLGFHWNNTRKCWQHPCGETLPRGQQEPRERYENYHPADFEAANPHAYNGPARTAEQVAA